MTITCCVCKKFSIRGDCRSFHKFPANDELKKKWMCAIGVTSVSKTATVCSDHFNQNSFHQTDGYTTVRRLLSGAIPSLVEQTNISKNLVENVYNVETINDKNFKSQNESQVKKNNFKNVSVESIEITDKNKRKDSVTTENKYELSTSHENATDINKKRKQTVIDNEIIVPTKKIRFMDGFQTKYVRKEDFVSNEAWENFLRYKTCRDVQSVKLRNKQYSTKKK